MPASRNAAQSAPPPLPQPADPLLSLLRHPATPCAATLTLRVRVARASADRLQLQYRLTGDSHAVLLPKRNHNPRPDPELWRHTCFEAFLATPGGSAYHEFNFSPSGDWAVFAFSSWRQRVADCSPALRPTVSLRSTPTALCLSVDTPLPAAARRHDAHPAGAALGLSAVIAHADGRRCYWALAHPCDDPDFHASAGWLATLPVVPPDRR